MAGVTHIEIEESVEELEELLRHQKQSREILERVRCLLSAITQRSPS